MCCFAFTSSNLGTLAMEHMAPIAGTASSVQGVVGTLGAAAIGFAIGQAFDGTALPFLLGIAVCALGGFLAIVADRAEAAVRRDRTTRADRTSPPDELRSRRFRLARAGRARVGPLRRESSSPRRPRRPSSAADHQRLADLLGLPRIAFSIRCATSGFSLR